MMETPPHNDKKAAIAAELESVRLANPYGLLRPIDVVARARSPKNILHGEFEWNDSAAADEFRLLQARKIIQVVVAYLPQDESAPYYISLRQDRTEAGGGYRPLSVVMADDDMRASALADAMSDFRAWKAKYNRLTALVPIFDAAERVERRKK